MIAADTSVLVPAVVGNHEFHEPCFESAQLVDAAIEHVVYEMYSVLTRLPQPFTVPADAAARAVASYATTVVTLGTDAVETIERLAAHRIRGGATYDAVIAATAVAAGATLLTRDERAAATYARLGADVRWVAT